MNFTVEEINVISIYHTNSREQTISKLQEILEDVDAEMYSIILTSISKLHDLSDAEFKQMTFDAATEEI